jgi:hypothetical protein
MRYSTPAMLIILFGFATPSYSQCASCGAEYNQTEREKVMPAYEAGKNQGYQQGLQDGANRQKLINSLNRLVDDGGQTGSNAAKGK